VYEARHAVLNKRVALKTLHEAAAGDSALRERFLREAELAARVRHPNVVDIHDAGVEDGVAFLVMELLEGEDLAQHLAREGRLLAREAVDIIVPVIAGLAELHRLGIAHRDVKPENIFLAYDPHGQLAVKLVDFGISKDFTQPRRSSRVECVSRERARRTFEGTPHYMAPEQMRGESELDPRSDQYALGVVLYQCLSGTVPYQGTSLLDLAYRVCSGEHTPLSTLRPDLPGELLDVVARAMSVDVDGRFGSMQELGQALLPFASPELSPLLVHALSRAARSSSLPPHQSSRPPARATPPAGDVSAEAPTLPHLSGGGSGARTRARSWGLVFALGLALSGFYALQYHPEQDVDARRDGGAGISFEHVLLGEVSLLH
jgi:serine/threonine protein kinase